MLNEAFDSFRSSLDYADNAPTAPTAQHYEVFKLLRGRLDRQLSTWKDIMSSDVPAFNGQARQHDIPLLYLTP